MILIVTMWVFIMLNLYAAGGIFVLHHIVQKLAWLIHGHGSKVEDDRTTMESRAVAFMGCAIHALNLISSYLVWIDNPRDDFAVLTRVWSYLLEFRLYLPFWIIYCVASCLYFTGRKDPSEPIFWGVGVVYVLIADILILILLGVDWCNPTRTFNGIDYYALSAYWIVGGFTAMIVLVDVVSCRLQSKREEEKDS